MAVAARSRRESGRPRTHLHGWLIIDKSVGMTSAQVVAEVRRLTSAHKAGHGGTLDPLATGILPIALGEATKTVPFVMDGLKSYRFAVRWGERRDTDDSEGQVIRFSEKRPNFNQIVAILPKFRGEIMQKPPTYSAKKVGGKRAYQLARAGQQVVLAPRRILIRRLRLVEVLDIDHSVFELECGKGTYVRSLARDIGVELGTQGHVSALRRTRVGPFTLDKAISLAQLKALNDSASLDGWLLPLIEGLSALPSLQINADQAGRLQQGQAIPLANAPVGKDGVPIKAPAVLCAVLAARPVALVDFHRGEIRPSRVFNCSL